MKVLISAEGTSLESRVSKRFGHAPHYVIVDSDTLDIRLLEGTDAMHKVDIIGKAAREGVDAIITGHIGPHAYTAIAAHELFAALAHDTTILRAVQALRRGDLKVLDAPTVQQSIEEHQRRRVELRRQIAQRSVGHANTIGYSAGTARGRHHLQQFSSRGH
jgi:predicted Fe-Mo cluster-binding NifX family protein